MVLLVTGANPGTAPGGSACMGSAGGGDCKAGIGGTGGGCIECIGVAGPRAFGC